MLRPARVHLVERGSELGESDGKPSPEKQKKGDRWATRERMNEKKEKKGNKNKNKTNASDQLATEILTLTVRVQ